MRPRYWLALLLTLGVGLECGYKIGKNTQRVQDSARIWRLEKKVERFENPTVFHHAEYVARVTQTSLYQVLTGRLDGGQQFEGGRP